MLGLWCCLMCSISFFMLGNELLHPTVEHRRTFPEDGTVITVTTGALSPHQPSTFTHWTSQKLQRPVYNTNITLLTSALLQVIVHNYCSFEHSKAN